MTCSICANEHPTEEMTEIGLGSNVFQCEPCWDSYGEAVSV
jgi:hypothetical protein